MPLSRELEAEVSPEEASGAGDEVFHGASGITNRIGRSTPAAASEERSGSDHGLPRYSTTATSTRPGSSPASAGTGSRPVGAPYTHTPLSPSTSIRSV